MEGKLLGLFAVFGFTLAICLSFINIWIVIPGGSSVTWYDIFPHEKLWQTIIVILVISLALAFIAFLKEMSEELREAAKHG